MVVVPTGNAMHVFAGHTGAVNAGAFTPDGKRILTGSQDGTLILWDPRSGQAEWKLTSSDARFGMTEGITSLDVNASSSIAVVGGADGSVRVVNLGTGGVTGGMEGHKEGESVESTVFVEGSVVITAGTDGRACVWDMNTMRLRVAFEHSVSRRWFSSFFRSLGPAGIGLDRLGCMARLGTTRSDDVLMVG